VITLRSTQEIDAIAAAGVIIGRLHQELGARIVPGITTQELDAFGEQFIRSYDGAEPAFKGLYGFPAALCISVNEEVVHGIPSSRRTLREGDIVSLDAGVKLNGWYADAACTFAVGSVDEETERLLQVTRASLEAAIAAAVPGMHLGDVGYAVQQVAEAAGFSVARDLVGHGIGREPHEEPQVPNFGRPGRGLELRAGLVIAIEPMVNAGGAAVRTLPDRWTVVTADRKRSAHFEHTVAVMDGGARILTAA
jgi:methionyl aminopeptidase